MAGMKQVLVIRKDLKMSKGKTAAQAAHASLEAYKKAGALEKKSWEVFGAKKVVLGAETLEELEELERCARREKLPVSKITDAGHTELPEGTVTALGIGPAGEETIDKVTGKLKPL